MIWGGGEQEGVEDAHWADERFLASGAEMPPSSPAGRAKAWLEATRKGRMMRAKLQSRGYGANMAGLR